MFFLAFDLGGVKTRERWLPAEKEERTEIKGELESEGKSFNHQFKNSQENLSKIVSSEPPVLSQKLAIFTTFHHPNHFGSFTKVVPKMLICLGN